MRIATQAARALHGGRALTCLLVLGARQLICKRDALHRLKAEGIMVWRREQR